MGTDPNNVWAVGSGGKILKWNGSAWSAQTSGTTEFLNKVWGTDANNIWAVGDNGTILKWTDGPPVTVPGAPTIGTATAGNASASVTFTAPASDGGSPITGYTVTSSSGSITGSGAASPITVTGLTNGTTYTFSVTATNGVGTGLASGPSNAVTPTTATTQPNQPPGFALSKLPLELWAWGFGREGQLGNSRTENEKSPQPIETKKNPQPTETDSGYQSVACGFDHTVAVKQNGELWAWGDDRFGQLGNGPSGSQTSPQLIGTDWQSVACGHYHTAAVKKNGELWVWGSDSDGQLGNGPAGSQTSPQLIGTDWQSVSCGRDHTVAVKKNGELWAWGSHNLGQLGNGAAGGQTSPQLIGTDWQSVACGSYHTVAVKRASKILWGSNYGARSIPGFASDITTRGEAGQIVSFTVTSSTPGLFSAGPAITPSNDATPGKLTFTPAAGQTGEALITVKATDNGGTTNGGNDTSAPQMFKIQIIANSLKVSDYVGNNNPINLVEKVLINNTGAPVMLPNPVAMGGTSGVNALPGQAITFTGPVTYASGTNLSSQGEIALPTCLEILYVFACNFIDSQAKLTTPNPAPANVKLATTLSTPAGARQARGSSGTVQPVPGRVTVPGQGEMTACSVRVTPLTNSMEFAATSFAPGGAGPGTLQTLNATWGAGVLYECDLNKADGTAGAAQGWDLWNCTGTLTLVPVSGEKHWISLRSLTTANVSGPMASFNKNAPYAWKIISAAGGITGFSPELFALDTTGIVNDFGGGSFGIGLQNAGKDLVVTYTPALRTANWTNDTTSGIDGTRGTLWARHFGSTTTATINGFTVPGIGTTTVSSPEFDLAGTNLNYLPVDVNNLSSLAGQGSAEMASHFVYNGSPAVLTFKQLTPGYTYTASLYTVGFDTTPNVRLQTFASGTDSRVLDPNAYGDNAGNRIDYTFTADAATRVLTITPVNPGATFALYGVALRLDTLLPPVVSAQAVTSLTGTNATLNGTVVSSDARSTFVQRGFVIAATAANPAPDLDGPGVTDFPVTGTTGAFSQAITNLLPGTPYSVAAYGENGAGVAYSSVVTFTTPTPVLLPAGAVSWYQAENNAQDSVGTNHATAAATTYTAGKVGQAFSLTGGANNYLNCTNNASLKLATGTVEAWIKTANAGSSYRGIMVKQFAYGLFLENNNLIGYDWGGGGGLVSSVNLADNNWHHVALSFTAGSMKLYADGVLVQSRTSFGVSNQNNALVIGAGDATGGSQNFNGLIDEATIYNRVLSAAEILSLYNAGGAGKISQTPLAPKDFNVTRNGANYGFNFTSVTGFTYTLWQSDTLGAGSWTNTGLSAIPGDGSVKTMTLPVPNASVLRRYYRLQVQ